MYTAKQKKRNQIIWITISIIAVVGMVAFTAIPFFN